MYVRHAEFVVPPIRANAGLIAPNTAYIPNIPFVESMRMSRFSRLFVMQGFPAEPGLLRISHFAFHQHHIAPLFWIFQLTQICFPVARILTLSGDITYNTNTMRHFPRPNMLGSPCLPSLPGIQVLILDAPWNVLRTFTEWSNVYAALPSLKECQCLYIQPRNEMYLSMHFMMSIIHLPLRHLNLNMAYCNPGVQTPLPPIHLCDCISVRAPYLQSITLTGCFCERLFTLYNINVITPQSTTIQSIQLHLVGMCWGKRKFENPPETNGLPRWNWKYFAVFERVVLGALSWLRRYRTLQTIRINSKDVIYPFLDMILYFEFDNGIVRGLWSDKILRKLNIVRPGSSYLKYEDGAKVVFDSNGNAVGVELPSWRPLGVNIDVFSVMVGVDLNQVNP